jgi:hypothetical protein
MTTYRFECPGFASRTYPKIKMGHPFMVFGIGSSLPFDFAFQTVLRFFNSRKHAVADEANQPGWFYLKPNQQDAVGPITADELKHLFSQGKVGKQTLVWTEGMEQWEEIGKLVSFQKTEKVRLNITSSHGSPKPGGSGEGEGSSGQEG